MIRLLLLINLLVIALPAKADRLWLVVGASDLSAAGISQKAKPLALAAPNSLIIQTKDCGDNKNVFAWAAEIATSANAAISPGDWFSDCARHSRISCFFANSWKPMSIS